MTLALLSGLSASAEAISCTAAGTFIFTVVGGNGTLEVLADGSATMNVSAGHGGCETCLRPVRTLRGTFRTAAVSDDGPCGFLLEVSESDDRTVRINGVVAFQGSVLMFMSASFDPDLAVGLALRTDMLRGQ